MVTRHFFARRRRGLTIADFQEHWRDRHSVLALGMPGLRRYIQNHALLDDGWPLLPHPGFDCLSELDFDDSGLMSRELESAREAAADEAAFLDPDGQSALVSRRTVLLEPRTDARVRLLTFMRLRPSADLALLEKAMRRAGSALHADADVAGHEIFVAEDPGASAGFAAAEAVWFPDIASALRHFRQPAARATSDLLAPLVLGRERVLVDPIRFR